MFKVLKRQKTENDPLHPPANQHQGDVHLHFMNIRSCMFLRINLDPGGAGSVEPNQLPRHSSSPQPSRGASAHPPAQALLWPSPSAQSDPQIWCMVCIRPSEGDKSIV